MTKKSILFLFFAIMAPLAVLSLSHAAPGGTAPLTQGSSATADQGYAPGAAQAETLANGDRAVVTGDYVRVRSGPTLEHRILDKVNTGTEVTVLSRGDKPQKIGDSTSYWYQVKLEAEGLSGWMYGAFLKKKYPETREEASANAVPPVLSPAPRDQDSSARRPAPDQRVVLREIGVIDEGPGPVASGDLDRNGKQEILFLGKGKMGRYSNLNGYEKSASGFDKVYSVDMQGARASRVEVLSSEVLGQSFLAAYDTGKHTSSGPVSAQPGVDGEQPARVFSRDAYASLYSYDAGRGALRLVSRLNTPALALGTLDGQSPYLVYLRRERTPDSDGTVSYTLETARIEIRGGKVYLREKYRYAKPLPVKKLDLFDLDRDGRDEIVAEIGGRDMGGGIVILTLREGSIARLVNSGIPTFNNAQFLSLWGADVSGKPQLVVYSTDPSGAGGGASEFGFILASMSEGNLRVDRFCPVNKMLDEVNNGRRVVRFAETEAGPPGTESAGQALPFLVIDSEGESGRSSVKKAYL